MNHFIWQANVLTKRECQEFIIWASRYEVTAESPTPNTHTVSGWVSSGTSKIESQLRNYASALKIDVYSDQPKINVLQYRAVDRVPWHPDYRPDEINFKVSVSICLSPGSHQLEYVSSSGVAYFIGEPGEGIFFPSWVAHRVTRRESIDNGDRWSLAAWLHGPEYR